MRYPTDGRLLDFTSNMRRSARLKAQEPRVDENGGVTNALPNSSSIEDGETMSTRGLTH